jgi:C4-type Zn-finger protein
MGNANYLEIGSYNFICDRCGFKFKSSKMKKEWNGLVVCYKCFEPRHPQDHVKASTQRNKVLITRPDTEPTFI